MSSTTETPAVPPTAYQAPPGVPPAPPPPVVAPPRRKRRWLRWTLLLILGALTVLVGLALYSAWALNDRIERIPAAELSSLDPVTSGPINYLVVGSDSRESLRPELGGFFGDFAGERADVIMIVHVLPGAGKVQMLSLPRDLKVEIPGRGTNRINAAYAFGGPDLLVRTVKQATQLPIHHYVEVGFGEFADVVDALGGVSVTFPYDAKDDKSGLSVKAGTEELDGPTALAFVRSRRYEELQEGRWVAVDQGDIGRTRRQQQVLSQILDRATDPLRLANAATWPGLAADLGDSLRVDSELAISDMAKLAWGVARAGSMETATLPVRNSNEGGVSYVVPTGDAEGVLRAFANGQPLPAQ